MFDMIGNSFQRGNPVDQVAACPEDSGPSSDKAKTPSWVAMPEDVLAIPNLSSNAKLLWLALQLFTWRGGNPTNVDLASKCGWRSPDGSHNTDKVKRAIRELEGHDLKLVEREINDPRGKQGWIVRSAIRVNRTVPLGAKPPDSTRYASAPPRSTPAPHPVVRQRPTPRSAPAPHVLDRCRSENSDSPRSRAGNGSGETTTTNPSGPTDPRESTSAPRPAERPAPEARREEPRSAPRPQPPRPDTPPPVAEPTAEAAQEQLPLSDEARSALFAAIKGEPSDPTAMPEDLRRDLGRLRELVPDLTAAQQVRFEKAGRKGRLGIIQRAELKDTDPVARKEFDRLMNPQRPVAPIPTREDAWSTIRAALMRRDPEAIAPAVGRIAQELGDHKSIKFYELCVKDVVLGARPIEDLDDTLRQAMNPKARNRGAVFVTAWERAAFQREAA